MLDIVNVLELSFDYLMLDNLTSNFSDLKLDKNLIEFKNILEELENEETIKEYIVYCKSIANAMIEMKKKKP